VPRPGTVAPVTIDVQTCYRHADRRAGVRCQRCERPICPSCMHQASVGFHCPECLRGQGQQVRTIQTLQRSGNPVVTSALVALNLAVYVVSSIGRGLTEPSFGVLVDWALVGRGLTGDGQLVGVAEGEWYRLVTGGFLHASPLHIGFNMYVLWVLGKQLEPAMGRVPFAAVYATSMLAGALGVMVLDPGELTVGASGAVFGLFGYALVAQYVRGVNPMQSGLGPIVLLNLAFTFLVPGISIGGHVGGLLGGVLAGLLHDVVRRRAGAPAAAGVVMVAALGVACAVAAISFAGA